MYGGDFSRKKNLVDHGFRLLAALDNRPLKFEEFEHLSNQTIYVSATPAEYELEQSHGVIIEQIIRPTGLLDPKIEVRPIEDQIDDLINEINIRIPKQERVLITTLTKRMAEELNKYLKRFNINCRYIHSDVDTIERVEIIQGLKKGIFDVLIGVNLLREGLDLPEVSLVAIMDADKEGFLRSERALTQTAGRTARNINGLVIMYADTITNSMRKTIETTTKRRSEQKKYNKKNNIKPKPLIKRKENILIEELNPYKNKENKNLDIEDDLKNPKDIKISIKKLKQQMQKAAKELNFIEAGKIRDKIKFLEENIKKMDL